jgi:hypothetical protein
MHVLAILILNGLGATGVWYGLVEDVKLAFFAALLAFAAGVIGTFRGNFNPPEDIPADARMDLATAGYTGAGIALVIVGSVGIWFGLVDDFKLGFLAGLVAFAAAIYLVFSGGPKPATADQNRNLDADATMKTLGLSVLIMTGLAAGAAGIWYALVDDVEFGFAAGLLVLAGTTVTAFRGKLAG